MPDGHLATPTTKNVDKSPEITGYFQKRTTGDAIEPPLLLRRLQVAHLIGVGGRTFDRLLACHQFPPADLVLNSKLIRWKRSTVETWIHNGGK